MKLLHRRILQALDYVLAPHGLGLVININITRLLFNLQNGRDFVGKFCDVERFFYEIFSAAF